MPLPTSSPLRPLPQFQQDRLRRWLTERAIDLSLPEVECPPPLAPEDRPPIDPHYDSQIEIGDIRILSWEVLPDSLAAVTVAVLATVGGRQWLVAPYSRYADAATPHELEIDPDGPADTRVLCLWNAHAIPHAGLSKSWRTGQLSTRQLDDALAVWHDELGAEALPERLQPSVGPVTTLRNDPRHQYLGEGSQRLAPIMTASLQEAERAEAPLAAVVFSQIRAATRGLHSLASTAGAAAMEHVGRIKHDLADMLAGLVFELKPSGGGMMAKGAAGSVRILDLSAGDTGARLQLSEQTGSSGVFVATIEDDAGQVLQGSRLLAPDGSGLAHFQDNVSGPFEMPAGVLLELRDGSLIPLKLSEHK